VLNRKWSGRSFAGGFVLIAVSAWTVFCAGRTVWGVINPNFTPVDLVHDADTIISGMMGPGANVEEWKLTGGKVWKGTESADVTFNLKNVKPDEQDEVKKVFSGAVQGEAILFAGTFKGDQKAFLSIAGAWMTLEMGGEGRWTVTGFNPHMDATYAGGSDMLVRMTQNLLAHPDSPLSAVPVSAGVSWLEHAKVGQVPGKICGMAAVEFNGDMINSPCIFVASSEGDKLFKPVKGQEEFTNVTATVKLDSKSQYFVWMDVDRDGNADLVSFDGNALQVRLVKNGVFAAVDPAMSMKMDDCLGLAVCGVSGDGAAGILVSTSTLPLLLRFDGKGWKETKLPAGAALVEAGGKASGCIVADLSNSGFVDVLQPREKDGILWKGQAGGFAAPVKCAVGTGGGTARFTVGDFNSDGWLDIYLAGERKNGLWENDRKGRFQDVLKYGGSLRSKVPPGMSACATMDLNHDGRPDLCFLYADNSFKYHFNRGYRCMGEEGEVKLPGSDSNGRNMGQVACASADFNADGSQDLAVAFVNGDVHCYYNNSFDIPGIRLRLKKGFTGPITASLWQEEKDPVCIGTLPVTGYCTPTFFAVPMPGEVSIKCSEPGKPNQVKKVQIEKGTLDVVLEKE
jgi:hypothetical protein